MPYPKKIGKQPTVYFYAIVVKYPVDVKAPIAVAELITEDHTVHSVSFFLQSFRQSESLLYGASNLINPALLDTKMWYVSLYIYKTSIILF